MTKITVIEIPPTVEATVTFTDATTPPADQPQTHVWFKLPQHPRPVLGLHDIDVFKNENQWGVYNEDGDSYHSLGSDPAVQPTAWVAASDEDRFFTALDYEPVIADITLL